MNFKKLTSDLTTSFNRAVQYTEEKLGQADRTAYEPEFEELQRLADQTQHWTERVIKATEAVLQPNPAHRAEDMVCEKLERERRERLSPLEELSSAMVSGGTDLGPTTDYGSALLRTGQMESELAQLRSDFVRTSNLVFLQPLRHFLDTDIKAAQKERRELEKARLDLDSARARARRGREPDAAEAECDKERQQFDRQLEVTRLLLEDIKKAHAHHLRCLKDFVEAQTQYHAECFHKMQELRRELNESS